MEEHLETIINWTLAGLSVVVLLVMGVSGALRERALALGPTRDLGLPRSVYVLGVVGPAVYVALMLTLGGLRSPAAGLAVLFVPFALCGLLIGQAMQADGGLRTIGLVPRRPLRDLRWAAVATPIAFALVAASMLLAIGISSLLNIPIEQAGHETLEQLQRDPSAPRIIEVVISAVILAPLLEELVFRGMLQTALVRMLGDRRWPALLIASALFSVTHWWVVPAHNLLPLFVVGLAFGYVYERTGSLFAATLTHAGFNALGVTVTLLLPPNIPA